MDFTHILQYSKDLAAHNDRVWFHAHHDEYDRAKKEFYGLLDLLRFRICEVAPALEPDLLYALPKDWAYRVARDMRFHKNGPPYNPAWRAYLAADKKSWMPVGYYLSIFPGRSLFGTGLWCESTAQSNVVRDYISANYAEFDALVQGCAVPLEGQTVKTMPRGYDKNDPAAEYLRYKNWELIAYLPDEEFTTFDRFMDTAAALVREMEPVRQFLLAAAKSVDGEQEFEW